MTAFESDSPLGCAALALLPKALALLQAGAGCSLVACAPAALVQVPSTAPGSSCAVVDNLHGSRCVYLCRRQAGRWMCQTATAMLLPAKCQVSAGAAWPLPPAAPLVQVHLYKSTSCMHGILSVRSACSASPRRCVQRHHWARVPARLAPALHRQSSGLPTLLPAVSSAVVVESLFHVGACSSLMPGYILLESHVLWPGILPISSASCCPLCSTTDSLKDAVQRATLRARQADAQVGGAGKPVLRCACCAKQTAGLLV